MNWSLNGKNALVCGGSKGIGFASAVKIASMGANIILLSRNEEELKEARVKLPSTADQTHHSISIDLNQLGELEEKLKVFIQTFGPISILINNTGGPPAGPIIQAKNEDFIAAFNQHLIANHTISTLLIPGMKEMNYGRIVNIISTSVKQPLPNLGVSNTVRAAVANWSKTMANELAPFGITVNNVLPGATSTDRLASIIETKAKKLNKSKEEVEEEMKSEVPMKRFGMPEEIAAAVAFLASPEASYITGINIPVDGGRTGCL